MHLDRPSSGEDCCFDILPASRFLALSLRGKYDIAHCCVEASVQPRQTGEPLEGVDCLLLVPHKFPYAILLGRHVELDDSNMGQLNSLVKKLNVIRRLKLVRSIVPQKAILESLARIGRELLGLGTLKISSRCLLSSETRLSDCRAFALMRSSTDSRVQQAVIAYDSCIDGDARISLTTGCTLLDFELTFAGLTKKASCVFLPGDARSVRSAGLMYCLVNLKSAVFLKVYFELDRKQQHPNTHRLANSSRKLFISKIRIVANNGLTPASEEDAGITFARSTKTHRLNESDSNYRFNISEARYTNRMQRSAGLMAIRNDRQHRTPKTPADPIRIEEHPTPNRRPSTVLHTSHPLQTASIDPPLDRSARRAADDGSYRSQLSAHAAIRLYTYFGEQEKIKSVSNPHYLTTPAGRSNRVGARETSHESIGSNGEQASRSQTDSKRGRGIEQRTAALERPTTCRTGKPSRNCTGISYRPESAERWQTELSSARNTTQPQTFQTISGQEEKAGFPSSKQTR